MKRFYTNENLSSEMIDAALLAGAKAVDGDSHSLSGVQSLQFDEETVIFSMPIMHPDYTSIRTILLKNFLIFQTSKDLFVPLSKNCIRDDNLLGFLKRSLGEVKIHLDIGTDPQGPAHGKWLVPSSDEPLKSHPFDFLHVLAAREIGLIEAMYGFSTVGNFEFSLDKVRRRKKDQIEEIAPSLWIDKILQDPQSGHISIRINILSRSGTKYSVKSHIVANGTMQDTNKLTEWVLSVVPCVVDRKGLGAVVKELLRHAFNKIDIQRWAVAGAECNTVIELTQEHHIA